MLDDGLMALRAESCGEAVSCTVTRGGVLESRKSITLPGVELYRPALTEQDLLDLDAAAGQGVTAVMQPFVRSRHELEQVRAALARLHAAPEETLYVGDSEVDVATARNAGLDMIGVAWGFRGRAALEAAGAPLVADTPEQLLDMLQ